MTIIAEVLRGFVKRDSPGKTFTILPIKRCQGQGQEGYNVFERGMSGGVLMASPRESKGSTKTVVPTQIEQKSRRTRNRTRPPPAPKNGLQFDPQVFLDTIGEGRKALLFPKKQTIFAQGDPADAVFYLRTGKVKLAVVSKNGKEATFGILGGGSSSGKVRLRANVFASAL